MASALSEFGKKLLIIPFVVAGVIIFWAIVWNREPAPRDSRGEKRRAVRVLPVPAVSAVPRALGYGVAQPGATWRAVAEVSGKIIMTSRRLKKGGLIAKGTLLLRIDPTDYTLAIARAEADIKSIDAQLRELAAHEANYRASLVIEQKAFVVSDKELKRKKRLLDSNAISASLYDAEERAYLAQKNRVQLLENAINLIPAKRQVLEAQLAVTRTQLDSARLDLKHTEITAPFEGRVAEVHVEETQFVQRGQTLAAVDSMDVAEVPAQVPISKMLKTMKSDLRLPPAGTPEFLAFIERAGLSAVVRLRTGTTQVSWPARVARIDSVNPKTRTVGVIVAVDEPYKGAGRTPLVKGMYCEVEIRGKARPNSCIVRRSALLQDNEGNFAVYLVGPDKRLVRRAVTVDFVQKNFAVISEGLVEGDPVVISDLIPAIPGMLLVPTVDEAAVKALVISATGNDTAK